MSIKYLNSCKTMEELKAEYKRMAKRLHPDCGGTDEQMAQLNNEYDHLAAKLPKTSANGETYQPETREAPEAFRAAVLAVQGLDGVELELCGCWLWATGDTRKHKDALKTAGYQWSPNKSAWYWHEPGYTRRGKKRYSMDEIRKMHGTEGITTHKQDVLHA